MMGSEKKGGRADDRFKASLPARLLLQIHDELVFETAAESVADLTDLVVEEMKGVGALTTPLRVDVKAGANWAECEPID